MTSTLAKPCLLTFAKNTSVVHKFQKDSGLKSASVPDIVSSHVFSGSVNFFLKRIGEEEANTSVVDVLRGFAGKYEDLVLDDVDTRWVLELVMLVLSSGIVVDTVESLEKVLKSIRIVELNADKGELFPVACSSDPVVSDLVAKGMLRFSPSMPFLACDDKRFSTYVCTKQQSQEQLGDDYDHEDEENALRMAQEVNWQPGHAFVRGRLTSRMEDDYIMKTDTKCTSEQIDSYLDSLLQPNKNQTANGIFHNFTYSELFSGIGGFGVSLRNLGGNCLFAVEMERHAQIVYLYNHPNTVHFTTKETLHKIRSTNPDTSILFDNVTTLENDTIPYHDVLTAGFPCQPFSKLGAQPGLHDEVKGKLILHVLRIAKQSKPKILLLENVLGLLTLNNGCVLITILRAISRIGYSVAFQVVDSNALCPQYRKRIYITCIRNDQVHTNQQYSLYKLPKVDRSVYDILDSNYSQELVLSKEKWKHIEDLGLLQIKGTWKLARPFDFAGTLVTSYKRGAYYNTQFVPIYEQEDEQKQHRGKQVCFPLSLDVDEAYANLVANKTQWYPFHPEQPALVPMPAEVRYYSVNECKKLMGFPNSFAFIEEDRSYAQQGNAVCPPIISFVAANALQYVLQKEEIVLEVKHPKFIKPVELALQQMAQALATEEPSKIRQSLRKQLE